MDQTFYTNINLFKKKQRYECDLADNISDKDKNFIYIHLKHLLGIS